MLHAPRISRVVATVAVMLAALSQACSDASSPNTASSIAPTNVASQAVAGAAAVATNECATPSASWIFCDDFETNRLTSYYEYDNSGGKFARVAATGMGGSMGMRATYTKGQASAGRLSLAFGREPNAYFRPVDAGTANYREIYWRFYAQRKAGWVGNGAGGMTRAMIFAAQNWSQAMVATGWSDAADTRYLRLDPLSGTDANGTLVTTGFNDAAHLRALGTVRSAATEEDQAHVGQWACYEFHVKLNDAGQSNGVFELSINGTPSAQKTGMNWVGSYNAYGINALNLEQYVSASGGAPAANVRTLDNFVVSKAPIGCGTTTTPPAPVATVTVALDSSSLTVPHTAQATATFRDSTGTVISASGTWSSSNTSVATVSSAGVVTAVAAGTANIVMTSGGKSGQAAISVVTSPVPVAVVSVALAQTPIAPGATTQATATTRDAAGNVLTGRTVTWSSSNAAVATVSSTGLVTGVAGGSANIIATSEGKTGQAALSVVAPVATVTVALAQTSIAKGATTQATATTRDASNNVLTGRTITWSSSNAAVATVSSSGVVTGVGAGSANIIATSEGKTGQAAVAVTVPTTPPATMLLEEKFEDANFSGRGWYDIYPNGMTSMSTDHIPGSTKSLQVNFVTGQTSPSPYASARHLFTPSTSVYLRYWVKYSTNFIGSGQAYHPHEFHFLTNEDTQYSGLASNYLTMYVEQNYQSDGGSASLGAQDGKNVDGTRINQDLTNVTENRAVSGCNGNPDSPGSCYQLDGLYYNGRTWKSPSPVFMPNPGPGYKADWHMVEVYFQLNSIVNGKGMRDGIAQYSIDGRMVIDRRDLYLRTGAHPNMKYNQFIMAPYIGNGSPINQQIWYDDLYIGTSRP